MTRDQITGIAAARFDKSEGTGLPTPIEFRETCTDIRRDLVAAGATDADITECATAILGIVINSAITDEECLRFTEALRDGLGVNVQAADDGDGEIDIDITIRPEQ